MISSALKLYIDHRLGGTPRYCFLDEEEYLMGLPDEVRKCVAFLAYWDETRYIFLGTAFWIGLRVPNADRFNVYLVTAKHLIEKAKEKGVDNAIHLRVNFKNTGPQWIIINLDKWYYHPSESNVDVAVTATRLEGDIEVKFVPSSSFVTQSVLRRHKIEVGNEVIIPGLFGNHTGTDRNIPIMRIGNIAAMPEEPIRTLKWAKEMDGYLIESRSIGGLSGSPVYGTPIFLLGLIHGHWDIPVEKADKSAAIDACFVSLEERINMGIAIVVPSTKIFEVLDQPELRKMRDKMEDEIREEFGATPDVFA